MPEIIFNTPRLIKGKRWSHISSDSIEYLHEFVKHCGMKREWFQDKHDPEHPHYDTYSDQIRVLLELKGAKQVDGKTYARKIIEWHRNKT